MRSNASLESIQGGTTDLILNLTSKVNSVIACGPAYMPIVLEVLTHTSAEPSPSA